MRAADEYVTSETVVWWDMNNCPIPEGYSAHCVGPSIDSALMNQGYKGPLTIIGIGNLNAISSDVLHALSSTGILLQHTLGNRSSFSDEFGRWKSRNSPPVTVMAITDSAGVDCFCDILMPPEKGNNSKYNLLLAYPRNTRLTKHFKRPTPSAQWFWDEDSLLEGPSALQPRMRSKAVQFPRLRCARCLSFKPRSLFETDSFEEFETHLLSESHKFVGGEKPTPKAPENKKLSKGQDKHIPSMRTKKQQSKAKGKKPFLLSLRKVAKKQSMKKSSKERTATIKMACEQD